MSSNVETKLKTIFDTFFHLQHPEAALRYAPVVREIKKRKLENLKILEIGSGSTGITPYLKVDVDALDIDFSGPNSRFINKIKGKATEIPFRKNSYDVSISVDVIEHIPSELREKAIFEMLKVTKKLAVIVVPQGQKAENQDKQLYNRWTKIMKEKNQFLEEHVKNKLPKTEEILVFVDKSLRSLGKRAKVKSYPNLSLPVRKILMYTWISKNKYIYYLYMKGFLLLLPLLKLANFGETYRRVFVIEFE